MFCKNCGKENADGVGYCVSCGCDLNKALPTEKSVTNNGTTKARTSHIPKTPLIIVCTVLVVLFALYQIAANATKPETVIKNHFTALVGGDYGAVYDGLDIPDGQFTSKEQFIASYTVSNEMTNKITSITITKATATDLEDVNPLSSSTVDAAYKVVYSTQLEPAPSTEIVILTKKGKLFLLFDAYKVEPSNFIAQEYSISAPVGIQVGFDGIELNDTFLSKVETPKKERDSENPTQRNIYMIPYTFFGEHIITATSEFTENYEAPVYVKSGRTETIDGLVIKADIRAKIRKMAEQTVQLFFDSALANKSFSDISLQLNAVPTQLEAIEKSYESFTKTNWGNFSNGATYTNIRMKIKDGDESGGSLTNRPMSPLLYRIGYTVISDAQAQRGYILWGDKHSERYFEMKIEFASDNGELKIYSVGR